MIECRDCGKRQSGRRGRRARCSKCHRPFVWIQWTQHGVYLGSSGVNCRIVQRGASQEKRRHPSGGTSSGRNEHRREGPKWYHKKDGVCRCEGLRF